jgi:serine/threonine protein kinase
MNCVLNYNTDNEKIIFMGREILNPIHFIKKLDFKEKLLIAPTHGDLHPHNIVIDENKNPHLIDFAWANVEHHFLVDFSLMECSLRFATLPNHLSTELLLKHDKDLAKEIVLHCGGNCSIEKEIWKSNKQYICHSCKLINNIRNHAELAYVDSSSQSYQFRKHYLISLYLMLFGLFSIPQYPKERCLLNLDFLSKEIQRYLDEK